ncbi:MAG: TonB-dependent receptor [Kiloniellaceae bacterium]
MSEFKGTAGRRAKGCRWPAGLLFLAVGLSAGTVGAQDATQEEPVLLNTIEVTATKRLQPLSEVDGAVSVRTGEELREAGVRTVEDLGKVFPGLIIRKRGNRAYSSISLRGVTSPDFYNAAVQVYVDGVPQDPAYLTQELVDVERVEVLRGPQGTLYGRKAHGGVINVITRKPDNELRGRLSGTVSTHDRMVDAGISVPIVEDMLYGALDIRRSDYLGQIHDVATGDDDIDDSRTWFGRAKLEFAPKDNPFSLALTAQHDELVSHEELYISEANLEGLDFDSGAQGGVNEIKRNVDSYALTAAYDFGAATLTSVTSYQDRDISKRLIQGFDTPEFQETLAEELRLEFGFGERWDGVMGLYFQDTDFKRQLPAIGAFFGTSENRVESQSYAAFGEVTYVLTDSLDLTGGLRWSYEDASIDYRRVAPGPLSIQDDDSFQDISPKIALGWQVSEDHRLYALVSRGFKPGGFNHTLPFTLMSDDVSVSYDSETSTNFELGWHGALFDDRVEAGAAAYWILTEDKQIYVGPVTGQYLRNAGEAQSYGVELEARVHATEDLTLDLGAMLGRSEFTDARDPDTGTQYDGNRVPFAPDYTFQAAARYFVPQDFMPGDISLRVAGTYVGRAYFDEANDLSQPGYLLLDAAVDLLLDNGISLGLFVDNITDKVYRTYSYQSGGDVFSSAGEGRVFGVTGRFEF